MFDEGRGVVRVIHSKTRAFVPRTLAAAGAATIALASAAMIAGASAQSDQDLEAQEELTLQEKTTRALQRILQGGAVQQQPVLQPRNVPDLQRIDPRFEAVRPREEDVSDDTVVIQFDAINDDPIAGGVALTDQYSQSHGVTFGRGATIETCRQVVFDTRAVTTNVAPSPCAYPSAASGQNVAHYDLRGGQALRLDFDRAIAGVSVKVNPTGGVLDEPFQMRLTGFDADGNRVASANLDFIWRQDAFSWPTTAFLQSEEELRMTRITMEMRRPQRANQSVRFLFDDLTLQYAPPAPNPVIGALGEQQAPPRIANPQIVQSPEDRDVQEELRLYPAATRIRTVIDWPVAEQNLGKQKEIGLLPAALNDQRAIDVPELPVLLPSRADAGTLSVAGQRDAFHADFDRDGRGYSIYGTRVLTRVEKSTGAATPARNLKIIEAEFGLTATFSLYGASYMLTQYCLNDDPDEDADCYNRDLLGDVAIEMVVAIGAAGERRP